MRVLLAYLGGVLTGAVLPAGLLFWAAWRKVKDRNREK